MNRHDLAGSQCRTKPLRSLMPSDRVSRIALISCKTCRKPATGTDRCRRWRIEYGTPVARPAPQKGQQAQGARAARVAAASSSFTRNEEHPAKMADMPGVTVHISSAFGQPPPPPTVDDRDGHKTVCTRKVSANAKVGGGTIDPRPIADRSAGRQLADAVASGRALLLD